MPSPCTILLFYLNTLLTLQFILAFAVMTGDKLESVKATQTTTIMETSSRNPTNKIPHNIGNLVAHIFALEEPCEVNDSSSNKKSSNCSSLSSSAISTRANICGSNSRLVGESCLCNDGYRKFPFSEVCVKKNGQHCVFLQNDCRTDLTNMACINNVCSCENSDIYDHTTSRCVGRVGGLCYPEIKDCTLNAECVNVPRTEKRAKRTESPTSTSSSYYYYQTDQIPRTDYLVSSGSDIELSGRCQCKEGFVESQGGLCKKAYGEACNSVDDCDSLHLVCKEGICSCPDALHVYDLLSESCVALAGGKCSNEPGGTLCVKLASCQHFDLKMDGKCVCNDDAVETNFRTCVPRSLMTTLPILSDSETKHEQASNRVLFNY